jgi:undecaprenyl-diphosphatase
MLVATASVAGLLINQIIGLAWSHPRPFMIGLGHTLIPMLPIRLSQAIT